MTTVKQYLLEKGYTKVEKAFCQAHDQNFDGRCEECRISEDEPPPAKHYYHKYDQGARDGHGESYFLSLCGKCQKMDFEKANII